MVPWRPDRDIPNQEGRLILLTGGTSGLGLAAAEILTQKGAQVIITGRKEDKGKRAVEQIMKTNPKGKVEYWKMDGSDLKNVRQFADRFREKFDKLDVLINNAGTAVPPHKVTDEGFEITMAANYFGPVYLTFQLLDLLERGDGIGPRVVYEASMLEQWGKVDWNDVAREHKGTDMQAYGTSKLYLIMIVQEMQKRFGDRGIDFFAAHPGLSSTSLYSNMQPTAWFFLFFRTTEIFFGQSPQKGATSMLYCATAPELKGKGGGFYGPPYIKLWIPNWFNTARITPENEAARDPEACARLFDETVRLLKERAPRWEEPWKKEGKQEQGR
jgi:NAD(P)-dependent dehydrogenase (short-subunit alcohol dehydrogenase family)